MAIPTAPKIARKEVESIPIIDPIAKNNNAYSTKLLKLSTKLIRESSKCDLCKSLFNILLSTLIKRIPRTRQTIAYRNLGPTRRRKLHKSDLIFTNIS
jgi:hypothetical protein